MYKVGDIVIYKREVCKIKEIKENLYFQTSYYVMNPIDDYSLKIEVPIQNQENFREIITAKEANQLISKIPEIEQIDFCNQNIEYIYKKILEEGSLEGLIQIIKTTYLRNETRISQNKKTGETDDRYLELAEKRLYNELSVSLDLAYEETKQYVIDTVEKLVS